MNVRIILAMLLSLPATLSLSQQISQTVRGHIVDQDSQTPLTGATVVVVGSDPLIGSVTDMNGDFRLTNVPIGRVTLKITFIGYEDRIIPNLLIGSAKEEVLNVTLAESVNTLQEITISSDKEKGEVLNEMAIVSSHTFSVEETQRFAGSFDDPARMVVAFAGVNGNAEGNNDIIVRGNSPKGILWRLEGIAIPNPNHFAGEGSTGGPINALSSKMLSNSDFFTGAFAPEYGDATSGVFDMKLKAGNNEQREYTASISTLGLDMTAEGPFKKGSRGSYIANYRYSALDLLDKAGIVDFGGVPRYQDLSFKIQLPVNHKHNFALFGLGGMSSINTEDKDDEDDDDRITGRFTGKNKLGVLGLSHTYQINDDMYIRSSLAGTGSESTFDYEIPNEFDQFYTIETGKISKSSIIASSTFNYKLNSKHKVETGIILTRLNYNMKSDEWNFDRDVLENQLSEKGHSSTYQAFASWKYRMTEDLTMIGGLHYIQFALNKNYSVEPRLALKWQVDDRQSFNAGVGLHSKLEPVSTYLAKRYDDNGGYTQPNKNLELTKAAHFILGYDRKLGENTHVKIETYYQHLYDVPVENGPTSFSLLNESEGYTTRSLVNEGLGKNYGVEITVERYLHKGLYYMGTLSLFRSLYTPLDGIERKSTFDNNYVANLIGGKEFNVGTPSKNKVFFINTKVALIGGKRYSPINLEESIATGDEVIDEVEPFSKKGGDIFRVDFSVGLRRNRKRTTSEFKFDVQNILNNQTVVSEEYIHATQSISKGEQLGLLPTISYKISF
jgi:hypothetical protein